MKTMFDEAKDLETFLRSNYDICHGRMGRPLHESKKKFGIRRADTGSNFANTAEKGGEVFSQKDTSHITIWTLS